MWAVKTIPFVVSSVVNGRVARVVVQSRNVPFCKARRSLFSFTDNCRPINNASFNVTKRRRIFRFKRRGTFREKSILQRRVRLFEFDSISFDPPKSVVFVSKRLLPSTLWRRLNRIAKTNWGGGG